MDEEPKIDLVDVAHDPFELDVADHASLFVDDCVPARRDARMSCLADPTGSDHDRGPLELDGS
jgi:hypothetical protein